MATAQFEPLNEDIFWQLLGERLRHHRRRSGLSLLRVESATNGAVTHGSLSAYERGSRKIGLTRLLELARLYQVPVDELLLPAHHNPTMRTQKHLSLPGDVDPVIILSRTAVHKCTAPGTGPLQRLLSAMDPHRQLSSVVMTSDQIRHFCVLYNNTGLELKAMFERWGVLEESSRSPAEHST